MSDIEESVTNRLTANDSKRTLQWKSPQEGLYDIFVEWINGEMGDVDKRVTECLTVV